MNDFYKENLVKNKLCFKINKHINEELINDHTKNIISIDLKFCHSSGLHPIQTILAAKSGINVCTEKPMALTISDAEEMIRNCEKFKVKLL